MTSRPPSPASNDRVAAKRRGFRLPSSEIYGGIDAVWDYGPLGAELKNNVKRAWWRAMVQEREDIVGLDAGILMHPQVWVTSGHVGSFSDPMVECATAIAASGSMSSRARSTCPRPSWATRPRREARAALPGRRWTAVGAAPLQPDVQDVHMGPVEEDASVIYLRPETAQGAT